MANKKVTELPTNTSPSGSEIYAVEGGNDYRIPVGGNNGIAFLGATALVPAANLGTGTADGTTVLYGDNVWRTVSGGGSGTVTSVAVANATGISWAGSPITTTGTLTPTLSANLQAWHALAPASKADASHTHSLSNLTQSGATSGQVATWNGSAWAPATPSGGGGGSGTVTSVQVSGGTTGLTYSGGPITTSGTITMAGTLAIANGGTGSSSAPAALSALGAAAASHTHAAGDITSGTISPSRLGSGTANSTTILYGDNVWRTAPGGGGSGTVTSVTLSGGTGLTVGGTNPITTSGTITLTLSSTLQSWSAIDPATKADLASPVFTGNPTAPTPLTADNDTSIATTAFVKAQGYAPLASPTFTGTVAINSTTLPTLLAADGVGTVNIPRIFVQSGDPGADAANGDLWIW